MCIQTQSPLPPPPPAPNSQHQKKIRTTKSSNAIKIKREQEKRDVVDKIEHAQTKSVTGQEKTHELGKYRTKMTFSKEAPNWRPILGTHTFGV